jgi:hypothetical protein
LDFSFKLHCLRHIQRCSPSQAGYS